MEVNFGISSGSAIRVMRKPLEPCKIHDVKFKGVEVREVKKKDDPSIVYKILVIKFENNDGYFNLERFYPSDKYKDRPSYPGKNGGTIVKPADWEYFTNIIKQTIEVLCPDKFEKFRVASNSFHSWDELTAAFISITKPVIDTDVQIKLIVKTRKNKPYTTIPDIVAVKDGVLRPVNNYIGHKLLFTDWEESHMTQFKNATPTEMKNDDPVMDMSSVDTNSDAASIDDLLKENE